MLVLSQYEPSFKLSLRNPFLTTTNSCKINTKYPFGYFDTSPFQILCQTAIVARLPPERSFLTTICLSIAGLFGREVGACVHLPLSCTQIERAHFRANRAWFLFKSLIRNADPQLLSNRLLSQLRPQRPHIAFRYPDGKGCHSSPENCTQRPTRGRFFLTTIRCYAQHSEFFVYRQFAS